MPYRVIRLAIVVIAAALASSPTPAAPKIALAFIAELNGRVDIARQASKAQERGSLGLPLQSGDKVQVGSGGSATLLFNDGSLVALSEKSSITVGSQAKPAGQANPVMAGVFKSVSEGVVGGSRETGLVALAPVRAGAARAEMILAPRQTEILEARPTFRWRPLAKATRYRVTITGDAGKLWEHRPPRRRSPTPPTLPRFLPEPTCSGSWRPPATRARSSPRRTASASSRRRKAKRSGASSSRSRRMPAARHHSSRAPISAGRVFCSTRSRASSGYARRSRISRGRTKRSASSIAPSASRTSPQPNCRPRST